MKDFIVINEKDNVGVRLTATDKIPAGHKFALRDIAGILPKANTL